MRNLRHELLLQAQSFTNWTNWFRCCKKNYTYTCVSYLFQFFCEKKKKEIKSRQPMQNASNYKDIVQISSHVRASLLFCFFLNSLNIYCISTFKWDSSSFSKLFGFVSNYIQISKSGRAVGERHNPCLVGPPFMFLYISSAIPLIYWPEVT